MNNRLRTLVARRIVGMRKEAQTPGYLPTNVSSNPKANAYENLANIHGYRGVARGVKNVIPGLVDFFVGDVGGALNGIGHGIVSGINDGRSFKDGFKGGFSEGYGMTKDFTKKYMSDPIRNAEMYYGGNAVKDMLDGAQNYWMDELRKGSRDTDYYGGYSPEYKERQKALAQMAGIEDGIASATEESLGLLAGVGGISNVKGLRWIPNWLMFGLPAASAPLSGFNNGRASMANRFYDLSGEWTANADMANANKDKDVLTWMYNNPDYVTEHMKRNDR